MNCIAIDDEHLALRKINRYVDISTIEREAKKDYIDRHSPFVHCESTAKKDEKFTVKVQLSRTTNLPDRQMLIYDKDRSMQWQGAITKEVSELMGGSCKEFFYARVEGTEIILEKKGTMTNMVGDNRMPKIQYLSKKFSQPSRHLIHLANEIVRDYANQGLNLTLRQLFYRFVATGNLPNEQREYNRLGRVINDARLAGLLDWDAIEDRGRNLIKRPHWDNPSQIINACAVSYAKNKWFGQDYHVEVWVEKQALEAVVDKAAKPLDVEVLPCKGYMSQSEMWRAAQRFKKLARQSIIIHLGDHDPSGIDMTRDIQDRLRMFGANTEVHRIALNMDQIEEYNPPPNPAKLSDTRAGDYIREHGDNSWELDALEPAVMGALITDAIAGYMDFELFNAEVDLQEHERVELSMASEHWEHVQKLLGKL